MVKKANSRWKSSSRDKKTELESIAGSLLTILARRVEREFYGDFDERFEDWFRDDHAVFEVELQNTMYSRRGFRMLLEIGCGDGQVLNYLSNSLPGIDRGIGIDINSGIIEENRRKFSGNSKLNFVFGDALVGIMSNMGKSCLAMSYGGVLEYFSENR